MRAFWDKIVTDIRKAPLWVWITVAIGLVGLYFAWRQLSGGNTTLVPTPTLDAGGGAGGGTGITPTMPITPTTPTTPTDPTPILPSLPTGGGSSGSGTTGGKTTSSSGGGSADVPIGTGYGIPINNPTAAAQREHRGLSAHGDQAPHPALKFNYRPPSTRRQTIPGRGGRQILRRGRLFE